MNRRPRQSDAAVSGPEARHNSCRWRQLPVHCQQEMHQAPTLCPGLPTRHSAPPSQGRRPDTAPAGGISHRLTANNKCCRPAGPRHNRRLAGCPESSRGGRPRAEFTGVCRSPASLARTFGSQSLPESTCAFDPSKSTVPTHFHSLADTHDPFDWRVLSAAFTPSRDLMDERTD